MNLPAFDKYGSPLYVFHEPDFRANYSHFLHSMKSEYEKYTPAYSFKTNYTPYICGLIREMGGYAEVVSLMEYKLARKIGFEPSEIIYNGPDKKSEIYEALRDGSIINADSCGEVLRICEYAQADPGHHYEFGLRVNLDLGQDFVSRFGMDEGDIERSFEYVKSIPNAEIVGLHCHISRCRGIEAWEKRTRTMLGLADRFFEHPPKYIDLGSGMFGVMDDELAAQFDDIPSYDDYASVTCRLVNEHYQDRDISNRPVLFTEPGTTLINKYISLISHVDEIKTVRGQTFAVLNCSEHNLGEICTLKKVPVEVIAAPDNSTDRPYQEDVDLVGYTCLEQDVMYTGYNGPLAVGDTVVFHNVGGYSNVLKPPFIRPGCAMITLRDDGSILEIKRAETDDDVMSTYVFE